MIPPAVKYNPFLNVEDFGVNIQNVEITKNSKLAPKKIFNKYNGESVVALWILVILSSI